MGEPVLGHDLVALGALAAAGAAQHPDDGQAGGGEGGAVHRLQHTRLRYLCYCEVQPS